MTRPNFKSLAVRVITIIIILLIIGILVLYQASIFYAADKFGSKYFFVNLQIMWDFIGLIVLCVCFLFQRRLLGRFSFFLWVTCMLILIFMLFNTPFAPYINGSKRWFYINPEPFPELPIIGRFRIQPSELTKLAVILFLSHIIDISQSFVNKNKFIIYTILIPVLPIALIARYNLSTALILGAIVVGMYFINGLKLKIIMLLIPIAAIGIAAAIFTMNYRLERFTTLINLEGANSLDEAYHINQILIALGSGGLTGLVYGQSRQKFSYVPEVSTDSIFSIIGEELGFIGGTAILFMLFLLILTILDISRKSENRFGRLFAAGVAFWVFAQTFINIGAMVRILPITGVPLPLISYGGSSTVFLLASFGIILRIASEIDKNSKEKRYGKV